MGASSSQAAKLNTASPPLAGPGSGAELRIPPWSRLLSTEVFFPICAYFCLFQLIGLVVRHHTWTKINVSDFKRYRLRNLTVCLIHSTMTGCWSLSFLLLYPFIMFGHTLHWYQPFAAHLPMIAIGYFCYDIIDMIRHEMSRWTLELLLHHVGCVFVFLCAVLPQKFLPYAAWALLMEVNSIFLHLRSVMQLSGESEKHPVKYIFAQASNIVTFVIFRFLVQLWQIQWAFFKRKEIHVLYSCVGLIGGLFFLVINIILFYRILASDGFIDECAKKKNSMTRESSHERRHTN